MARSSTTYRAGNIPIGLKAEDIGRPNKWPEPQDLLNDAIEYVNWCEQNTLTEIDFVGKDAVEVEKPKMRVPTIEGFMTHSGTVSRVFREYALKPDFAPICEYIANSLFSIAFEGASAGLLNSQIIMRKLGLADKKEVQTNQTNVHLYVPDNNRKIEDASFELLAPPEIAPFKLPDEV